MDKQLIAANIRNRLDVQYSKMVNNPNNAISYQDCCILCDFVEKEFREQTGGLPQLIAGACCYARAALNPNIIERWSLLQKGVGLLLTSAGGLAICWGIMLTLGVGLSLWAKLVILMTGAGVPIMGPIAIAAGVALFAGGVFAAIKVLSPTTLSASAHSTLVNAINEWGKDTHKSNEEIAKECEQNNRFRMMSSDKIRAGVAFCIISKANGRLVDAKGPHQTSGMAVHLWQAHRPLAPHQQWNLDAGENGYWKIRSVHDTTWMLSALHDKSANGQVAVLHGKDALDSYLWRLQPQADGSYILENRLSRVLDAAMESLLSNGTKLQLWDQHGGENQRWVLKESTKMGI